MFAEIEKILEVNVRPRLAEHYGNIELIGVKDGIVEVKLLGECNGCLSAKYTIEDMVEVALKESIPGIKSVMLKNEISEELLEEARKILNHGMSKNDRER
ncbi:NifU family protein [Clostridium sp.]|uniref:NifU family protein n=1 Tax=Clostridium sp. TaxID=1506 RepID=UPI003D6D77D9